MGKRYAILLVLLILTGTLASAQEALEGRVSYITSQHVYVRFSSTQGLADGDTLYKQGSQGEVPALVILNHSSTSCVCKPLEDKEFVVSESVVGYPEKVSPAGNGAVDMDTDRDTPGETRGETPGETRDETRAEPKGTARKQEIDGRFSVASYSFLKNAESEGRERLRYTFSMAARNIGGSGLTLETYTTFSHTLDQWDDIKEDVFNGLKIYNLSASYAFSESMILVAGRKFNPKLSSVGAIDGLQFEKRFGSLSAGIILGFRPDYQDYSFNTGLFQYGAYLGHDLKGAKGNMQNTLAYIEQMNQGQTDRRFVYFQHSNSLVSNLWFFGSVEADLYQKVDESEETVFNLYSTYLNVRYRIGRPLTLSLSYSARNKLIYYESYKDFLDRLLDEEVLQGWRFRVNYRPIPNLYLAAHAAYRYRKDDPLPTKNAHGSATYTNIPGIGASLTATITWMQSAYLDGMVYGLGIGREFLQGKLHADLKYHFVDYNYRSAELGIAQHVGEAGLTWAFFRKMYLSLYYEGTFEDALAYNRIFAGLSLRF